MIDTQRDATLKPVFIRCILLHITWAAALSEEAAPRLPAPAQAFLLRRLYAVKEAEARYFEAESRLQPARSTLQVDEREIQSAIEDLQKKHGQPGFEIRIEAAKDEITIQFKKKEK